MTKLQEQLIAAIQAADKLNRVNKRESKQGEAEAQKLSSEISQLIDQMPLKELTDVVTYVDGVWSYNENFLTLACRYQQEACALKILKRVRDEHPSFVETFLQQVGNMTTGGLSLITDTPLSCACNFGLLGMIKAIMDVGGPNAKKLFMPSYQPTRVIMLALYNSEILKLLLDTLTPDEASNLIGQHSGINQTDSMPLYAAVEKRLVHSVYILFKYGAYASVTGKSYFWGSQTNITSEELLQHPKLPEKNRPEYLEMRAIFTTMHALEELAKEDNERASDFLEQAFKASPEWLLTILIDVFFGRYRFEQKLTPEHLQWLNNKAIAIYKDSPLKKSLAEGSFQMAIVNLRGNDQKKFSSHIQQAFVASEEILQTVLAQVLGRQREPNLTFDHLEQLCVEVFKLYGKDKAKVPELWKEMNFHIASHCFDRANDLARQPSVAEQKESTSCNMPKAVRELYLRAAVHFDLAEGITNSLLADQCNTLLTTIINLLAETDERDLEGIKSKKPEEYNLVMTQVNAIKAKLLPEKVLDDKKPQEQKDDKSASSNKADKTSLAALLEIAGAGRKSKESAPIQPLDVPKDNQPQASAPPAYVK